MRTYNKPNRLKKGGKNRRFASAVVLAALFSILSALPARAAAPYYEHREAVTLAKGVYYELNRQMTGDGMLDIHVLYVSLDDPYIAVNPVDSAKELGLKETARQLLSDAGAVAGVNADFFGLAGAYSMPFGPVTADGQFIGASAGINAENNDFAALMITGGNAALMRYVQTELTFLNNGAKNISVSAYNKLGASVEWPIILDRLTMEDTSLPDKRSPGTMKVVVQNNYIVYISQKGEKVSIPENGYVLIIPEWMADSYGGRFHIGEWATFNVSNNLNIDYAGLKSAVGGGGLLLAAGQTVHDKGVAVAGRQPRTAVGVTRDGKTLLMMTVDGRTHSVGATHDELAALMLRYGAYDAMHLDGGGSSTMVTRSPETGAYDVVNTVSDGAERRIMNALGVFDRSPVGAAERVLLKLSQERTFVGAPVTMDAIGQDRYLHNIELEDFTYSVSAAGPDRGVWVDERTFIPTSPGMYIFTLTPRAGGLKAFAQLYAYEPAEIICAPQAAEVLDGASLALSFSGLASDCTEVPANNAVSVEAVPPELAYYSDGVLYGLSPGSGYLDCYIGGLHTYVPLAVGGYALKLNALNSAVDFTVYPDYVSGGVSRGYADGRNALKLDYVFEISGETQAAYADFTVPQYLPSRPIALRMDVYGDNSGFWLRGRVTDARGRTYPVDFAREVDFEGWRTLTAMLPDEAERPLTLDRLYIASLGAEEPFQSALYFDNLELLYAPSHIEDIPKGDSFKDPLNTDLRGADSVFRFEIKPGQMTYTAERYGSITAVTLNASQNGIFASDKNQWGRLPQDVRASLSDNIVILLDVSPLGFKERKEFELLHTMLAEQQRYGRKVFVAAPGEAADIVFIDGVRYITLAGGGDTYIDFLDGAQGIRFDARDYNNFIFN